MKAGMTRQVAIGKLLDLVWPPTCPICSENSMVVNTICARCWAKISVALPPKCAFCGMEIEGLDAQICAQCYDTPRSWDYGSSAVAYGGIARVMVLRLKNMRAENMARLMAKIAYEECAEFFEDVDVLVPIPLHWRRLFERGFNQAALLAYHLGKLADVDMKDDVLKRRRATKKQIQLASYEARMQNLDSAFVLKRPDFIRGKRVVLVDDVMTSGSSFEHATKVLRQGEPASVGVFAFARAGEITSNKDAGSWNLERLGLG